MRVNLLFLKDSTVSSVVVFWLRAKTQRAVGRTWKKGAGKHASTSALHFCAFLLEAFPLSLSLPPHSLLSLSPLLSFIYFFLFTFFSFITVEACEKYVARRIRNKIQAQRRKEAR